MPEKITIKSKSERLKPALHEGDIVEFGVTHELKINGDASWVSFKAASKVQSGESPDEASERLIAHVNNTMEKAVKATVESVEGMSE